MLSSFLRFITIFASFSGLTSSPPPPPSPSPSTSPNCAVDLVPVLLPITYPIFVLVYFIIFYFIQSCFILAAGQSLLQLMSMGSLATDLHMLSVPAFSYPLKADSYAAQPVPSLEEFEQLWTSWDTVTRHMIPEDDLLSKPIKLRNCCLFYLGHIPTFLDIHLARATDGTPSEPSSYRNIFERGIDPDVDNPEHCHAHSDIPDSWPPVGEILEFQDRVRNRVRLLYRTKKAETDRKLGRALWLGFEHEGAL